MNNQNDSENKNIPQFYRQRFLIAMIQIFNKKFSKTDFQKLLFLYNEIYRKDKKIYYFVPYKFGPFSFQVYADLRRMVELGLILENDNIESLTTKSYISLINKSDQEYLIEFKQNYFNISGDNLIQKIYKEYPYYAKKSEILDRIGTDLVKETAVQNLKEDLIYSLGYEGISLDQYLNILILKDIKTVIDVRKNPISMKYGFSRKTLENALKNLDIKYISLPALGIDSKNRKELSTLESYNTLFDSYEKEILQHSEVSIQKIIDEFKRQKRVVLTCFEKDPNYCHRSRICKLIEVKYKIRIEHL